jgi:hypothetical protein
VPSVWCWAVEIVYKYNRNLLLDCIAGYVLPGMYCWNVLLECIAGMYCWNVMAGGVLSVKETTLYI